MLYGPKTFKYQTVDILKTPVNSILSPGGFKVQYMMYTIYGYNNLFLQGKW